MLLFYFIFSSNKLAHFHSGFAHSHSYQHCISQSPTLLTSALYILLMIAILILVSWNLNVVLIYIFLLVKDVGHFSYNNSSFILSWEHLFHSSAHLLARLLPFFPVVTVQSSFYILDPVGWLASDGFLWFCSHLLTMLILSFRIQKLQFDVNPFVSSWYCFLN